MGSWLHCSLTHIVLHHFLHPPPPTQDLSCSENDPNFPFYDDVHGMYHLFYQDHLYINNSHHAHGPDIGHGMCMCICPSFLPRMTGFTGGHLFVDRLSDLTRAPPPPSLPSSLFARDTVISRDFVHWAHLPVAIWNDQWYDNAAIFTGSATVVNGIAT
jgi:hypothetical protein